MKRNGSEEHGRHERRARRMRGRVLRFLVGKAIAEFRSGRERRPNVWQRAVASRDLRSLSDRMLRDIGMLRSDLRRMG